MGVVTPLPALAGVTTPPAGVVQRNDESGDNVNIDDINVDNMKADNINYNDDVDEVVDVDVGVNDHENQVGIRMESFLGFLNIDDTIGQGLSDVTQAELNTLDLDIDDVRGQGYDNGSNMKGKHRGLMLLRKLLSKWISIHCLFRSALFVKKRHFDKAFAEEDVILSAEESFKVNYFLYIGDQTIASLTTRFEQYQEYENIFGFLFTRGKLNFYDDDRLKSCCSRLEAALKNGDLYDINVNELYVELRSLNNFLSTENMKPIDVLNFLNHDDCYPNEIITDRVLLTIPVTMASAERSFSKLKLIKSYLRSSMSQEMLNGLALIAIENDILESVDYEDLINSFGSKNARRIILFK
nr:zinc finger MYM-type protein 1 [Tanacetum cinerariifolium]